MSEAETTAILVFAKAPVAGAVKTRLAPRLDAEGAAQLHKTLVRHALTVARDAAIGDVVLYCAPDCTHPFFRQCAKEFGVALRAQSSGDLGLRMYIALAETLKRCKRVLLMGADCPALDSAALCAAASALSLETDVVFIPAEDGGYVLIGARRIDTAVFNGIEWGSALVMQQTRDRLQALKWTWREQPTLWDVDRPEDLERLQRLGWQAIPGSSAETV